ncbi:GIY-YIG nuclease family protein [Nostoc sp. DSM 114161]|jgi:hypothetical protein|uniref:GIY-YIG nuclease family protein n=1 Tax=Nostoc sp. DSM 114161 TaxID=3440143 RepID=UPI00404585F2
MTKKGTVYLINAKGTNRYKIGYTNRPFSERLAEINRGQIPYPLTATKTILVEDAYTVELTLHHQFAGLRKYGEWFEFSSSLLKEVCKEMDKLQKQSTPISKITPFLLMIVGLITLLLPLFLKHCQQPQPKAT